MTGKIPIYAFQFAIFFSLLGLNPTAGGGGSGSILRQAAWLILFAASTFALLQCKELRNIAKKLASKSLAPIILLSSFTILALLSSAWSEVPEITTKRTLLLAIVVYLCYTTAASAGLNRVDMPSLVIAPLSILLGLSVLFSIAFPSIAFTNIGWQGITGQKNEMGQLAAMLILATLFSNTLTQKRAKLRLAILASATLALTLSQSSTSQVGLIAAIITIAAIFLVRKIQKEPTWLGPAILIPSVLAGVGFLLYMIDALPSQASIINGIFSLLGKSDTFTGRTALWDLVIEQKIYRSEWIGGGYGSFWDISQIRAQYILSKLGFTPIQAHNGYLDVFNDLGYIGLLIAFSVIAFYIFSIIKSHSENKQASLYFAPLAVYLILVNLSESSLFRTTQFLNLLFLTSIFVVAGRKLVKEKTPALQQ